ncbi:MAG: hypothetical protein ABI114_04670 [Rhodanobacter sp.]
MNAIQARPSRWRQLGPWLLLAAVALITMWLRYGLIESSTMGQLCSSAHGPWWCSWRQLLVLGFLHDVYGVLALAAAALALLQKHRWLAWLAAALGVFALELYCFETGALALLIGCLRLLRLQANTMPVAPDRPSNSQAQRQP